MRKLTYAIIFLIVGIFATSLTVDAALSFPTEWQGYNVEGNAIKPTGLCMYNHNDSTSTIDRYKCDLDVKFIFNSTGYSSGYSVYKLPPNMPLAGNGVSANSGGFQNSNPEYNSSTNKGWSYDASTGRVVLNKSGYGNHTGTFGYYTGKLWIEFHYTGRAIREDFIYGYETIQTGFQPGWPATYRPTGVSIKKFGTAGGAIPEMYINGEIVDTPRIAVPIEYNGIKHVIPVEYDYDHSISGDNTGGGVSVKSEDRIKEIYVGEDGNFSTSFTVDNIGDEAVITSTLAPKLLSSTGLTSLVSNLSFDVVDNNNYLYPGSGETVTINVNGTFDVDPTKIDQGTATFAVSDPTNIYYNTANPTNSPYKTSVVNFKLLDTEAPVFNFDNQYDDLSITTGNIHDFKDGVTAKDNVDGDVTDKIQYTFIDGFKNDGTDVGGVYKVEYTVSDISGNTTTEVIEFRLNDKIGPVFDVFEKVYTSERGHAFTYPEIKAFDAVDGEVAVVEKPIVFRGDGTDPVGNYVVSLSATDKDNNQTIEYYTVKVVDTTKPVITLPYYEYTINEGDNYTVPRGTATDFPNIDISSQIVVDKNGFDLSSYLGSGVYYIDYNVTDSYGNKADTVQLKITIRDTLPPQIYSDKQYYEVEYGTANQVQDPIGYDRTEGVLDADISYISGGEFKDDGTDDLGTYVVRYTYTDKSGNTSSVDYTIKVVDTTKPQILVNPSTIKIKQGESLTFPTVFVQDNYDPLYMYTGTPVSDKPFDNTVIDIYTFTYTVQDSSGNEATAKLIVEVVDGIGPEMTLVGGPYQSLYNSPVNKPQIQAIDNVDGDVSFDVKLESSSPAGFSDDSFINPPGIYTLTYSVTDSNGNKSTLDVQYTVIDNEKPQIILSYTEKTVQYGEVVALPTYNSVDNYDGILTTQTDVNLGGFVGDGTDMPKTYTLTYKVTDSSGNETIETVKITVEDNVAPVITLNKYSETISFGDMIEYPTTIAITDNVPGQNLMNKPTIIDYGTFKNDGTDKPGTYDITFYIEDEYGNEGTATYTVTVVDDTAPVIDVYRFEETIEWGSTHVYGFTTTDDVDGDLTSVTDVDKGTFVGDGSDDIGSYDIKFSITDSSGNYSEVIKTVVVKDTVKPVIKISPAQTFRINYGETLALPTYSATDNYDGVIDNSKIVVNNQKSFVGDGTDLPGTYVISYNVSDSNGNAAVTKYVTIIVEDAGGPEFDNLVTNYTINYGETVDVPQVGLTATDDVDGDVSNTINAELATGFSNDGTDLPGTYTINYSAYDSAGNYGYGTVTVTIEDKEAPVIHLNPQYADIEYFDEGETFTLPTFTVTDNVPGQNLASRVIVSNPDGIVGDGTMEPGTYVAKYTVTDDYNNTTERVITVVIRDKTPPVITLDKTSETINYGEIVTYPNVVSVTDNYDTDIATKPVVPDYGSFANNGTDAPGEYQIKYSVTDNEGNVGTAIYTVKVVDVEAPVIELTNTEITIEYGDTINLNDYFVRVTDNYDESSSLVIQHDMGTFNNDGTDVPNTYIIKYHTTDSNGNKGETELKVIVEDNEKPTLVLSSNNRTFEYGTYVTFPTVTAIDNLDGNITASVLSDQVAGFTNNGRSPIGNYEKKYYVTDSQGNYTEIYYKFKIVDTTAPSVTQSKKEETIEYQGTAELVLPYALDYYDGVITTYDLSYKDNKVFKNDGTDDIGTYVLIYKYTDSSGNSTEVTYKVNVVDTTKPVITFNNTPYVLEYGDETLSSKLSYTVTDNYDGTGLPLTFVKATPTFDVLSPTNRIGNYVLTYKAIDSSGNETIATLDVKVVDNKAPQLELDKTAETIEYGSTITYPEVTVAEDNYDGQYSKDITPAITPTFKNDGTDLPGTYTFTYSVTDSSGNKTEVKYILVVKDTTAPNITISSTEETVRFRARALLPKPTAFDDLDGVITNYTISYPNGTEYIDQVSYPGDYTIRYTFTDSNGNSSYIDYVVKVRDMSPPLIILFNDDNSVITGSETTIDYGTIYEMPNVRIADNVDGGYGLTEDQIEYTLNQPFNNDGTDLPGTYVFTYTHTDSNGNVGRRIYRVHVVDNEPPVIREIADMTHDYKDSNPLPTIYADDNVDGEIEATLISNPGNYEGDGLDKAGTYKLTYEAVDSSGNKDEFILTIVVTDNDKPTLNVEANSYYRINYGETVAIPPYSAFDRNDGEISSKVDVDDGGFENDGTDLPGIYYVTYNVCDSSNNCADEVKITVEVVDKVKPTIVIAPKDNYEIEVGETITYPTVTATDNVVGQTPRLELTNLNNFKNDGSDPVGTYSIVYKATDSSNNFIYAVLTITVKDETSPVLVLTTTGDSVEYGSIVDLQSYIMDVHDDGTSLTASDVTINKNGFKNDGTDDLGMYTIDYVVKDDQDNETKVTLFLSVVDSTAPIINVDDDDLEFTVNYGEVSTLPTVNVIENYDNLTAEDLTINYGGFKNDGSDPLGVYYISYDITDSSGNVADQVVLRVFVEDIKGPVITPSPLEKTYEFGTIYDPLSELTAIDNLDGDVTQNLSLMLNPSGYNPTGVNDLGTYMLVYTVGDDHGNGSRVEVKITVEDTTAPILTVSKDKDQVEYGEIYDFDAEISTIATDNHDVVLTVNRENGSFKNDGTDRPGEYVIKYTVTDSSGNSTEKEVTITVVDTKSPVITKTPDLSEYVIEYEDSFTHPLTATDNVDGDITSKIKLVESKPLDAGMNQSVFNESGLNELGTYEVTYEVVDSSNNSTKITLKVKVVDTTAPNITEVNNNSPYEYGTSVDVLDIVEAIDNYDGDITDKVEVVSSPNFKGDGTDLPGTYELTYKVVDSSNNSSNELKVTIDVVADSGKPTITLSKTEYTIYEGQKIELPTYSASDSIDGDLTSIVEVIKDSPIFNNDGSDTVGTYTITYKVKDKVGNEAVEKVIINVLKDDVNPNLTVVNSEVTYEYGEKFDLLELATAEDNVDGDISGSITYNGTPEIKGDGTDSVGTYTVTYSVSDKAGNSISKDLTVHIKDSVKPVITVSQENYTIFTGESITLPTVTATDNYDGDISSNVKPTYSSPAFKNDGTDSPGIYTITYDVVDSSGNSSTSEVVTIEVRDLEEKPVISLSQTEYTIYETEKITLPIYNAIDKEDGDLTNSVKVDSSEFANDGSDTAGTYKIYYSVTDSDGNTDNKEVTINVIKDTEKPVFDYSTDTINVEVGYITNLVDVTATDNLDGDITDKIVETYDQPQFKNDGTDSVGTYTITYKVTDSSGNSETFVLTINVTPDKTPPTISTTTESETFVIKEGEKLDLSAIVAVDNIDGTISNNISFNFGNFKNDGTDGVGTYRITATVTDKSGNITNKTFKVIVEEADTDSGGSTDGGGSTNGGSTTAGGGSSSNGGNTTNPIVTAPEQTVVDTEGNETASIDTDEPETDESDGIETETTPVSVEVEPEPIEEQSGLNIIGKIIGILTFILAVGLIKWWFIILWKRRKEDEEEEIVAA